VRTLRAPKTYKVGLGIAGFDAAKDPTLRSHRIRMVHTAMVHLHRCGLVRYDPRARSVQPTPQGRIASHYYLSCDSMRTISRAMRPTLSDVGILRLFATCHEFQNVRCRRSEKLELRTLVGRVPIPVRESVDDDNVMVAAGTGGSGAPATNAAGVTLGQTGSGAAKVNVLLQAYISRLPLKGFALAADMVYIRQSAARLFRALFDLSLRRGWSRLSLRLLGWCQMVERRMWTSRTPLRQFVTASSTASMRGSDPAATELSSTLLTAMERRAVPWSTLKEMQPHELGELVVRQGMTGSGGGTRGSATTQTEVGKLLYRKIHQLPCLAVGATVQPLSRSTLRVELSLQADFQWPHPRKQGAQKNATSDAGAISAYPSGIDFHIIVEDGDGERVLHHERFHLRRRELAHAHVRVFAVPLFDPLPPQYFIRVVCDRWMHCSVTVPVVFRNQMVLPALNPPPTALLDLRPVTFGSAGRGGGGSKSGGDLDARHASLLSLAHPSWGGCLNAMQTQCLPVLYETDANVLLCAPPGTGKVGAAELAVLRTLGFGKKDGQLSQLAAGKAPSARVVFVCSRRGRCRMVLQRWQRMMGVGLGMNVAGLGFETGAADCVGEGEEAGEENQEHSKNRAEDVLAANDVVVTTTRAWEFVSRGWQRSAAVQGVRLLVVDQMQLVGAEGGSLGGAAGADGNRSGSTDGGSAEGGDDDDGGLDYLEEAALGGIGGTASVAAELELVVSRMRFMSAQLKGNGGPGVRIVALSSCMANGVDVGHWIGAKSFKKGGGGGIFSFAPEVGRDTAHPVQIRVRSFDSFHHASRFAAMGKPCFDAARSHREREKVGAAERNGFRAGVLVFAPGRMQAQTTAIDMVTFGMQGKHAGGADVFLPREGGGVPSLVPGILGGGGGDGDGDDVGEEDRNGEAAALGALDGDATLKELLKSGVGYTHPGQSLRLRRILASALRWGHIGVLVATPSLAWELDIRDAPALVDSSSSSSSSSLAPRLFALAVVVKACERWSGASRRHISYPSSLLAQMCGVAGCSSSNGAPPESLLRGVPGPTVTLLVSTESKPRVVAGLAGSLAGASSSSSSGDNTANVVPTIESQIDTHLHDEFLSLAASGAVESRQDALDYLTWTLLYRRLAKNPNYYGLARADAGGALVAEHLSELVEDTLADLGDSGCIDMGEDDEQLEQQQTEDSVTPLNLGMIAAFYAARYTTLEIFAGSVRPRLRVREALEVLCAASEFEQGDVCRVRQGDGRRIRELSKRCALRISSLGNGNGNGNGGATHLDGDDAAVDIHVKANLLIQTYLDRKRNSMLGETQAQRQLFTGAAGEHLRRDRDRVLCVAVRLVKALVDVAAQSCQGEETKGEGSLRSTLACCELSQLLVMGVSTGDSPLLQIPHVTAEAVKRCEAAGDVVEDEDGEKRYVAAAARQTQWYRWLWLLLLLLLLLFVAVWSIVVVLAAVRMLSSLARGKRLTPPPPPCSISFATRKHARTTQTPPSRARFPRTALSKVFSTFWSSKTTSGTRCSV
jgi:pre-mRNA-splicing helicase BRR2